MPKFDGRTTYHLNSVRYCFIQGWSIRRCIIKKRDVVTNIRINILISSVIRSLSIILICVHISESMYVCHFNEIAIFLQLNLSFDYNNDKKQRTPQIIMNLILIIFDIQINYIIREKYSLIKLQNQAHIKMNRLKSAIIDISIKGLFPFFLWAYNPSWHRRHIIKILLITISTPIIGIFRAQYVRRQFGKQLQAQIQQKQIQLKESFENIDFNIKNVDADYIIAIKSNPVKYDQEVLYDRQKVLFQLNNQIQDKSKVDESYFDGIKFIFIGSKHIFEVIQNSSMKKKYSFGIEYLQKKSQQPTTVSQRENQDKIFLIAKQADGSHKILLQLEYEVKLQSILRQISKHKHKKYLQSMNF